MYASSFLAYLSDKLGDVDRRSRGSRSVAPLEMAMMQDQRDGSHKSKLGEDGERQRYMAETNASKIEVMMIRARIIVP